VLDDSDRGPWGRTVGADIAALQAALGECTASLSGDCLREAESETACDTEAGECVHGGKPGGEAQQDEPDDTLHACPGRWGGPSCTCFDNEQTAVVSQPVEPEKPVAYQSTGGQLLRCLAHKPSPFNLELGCFHPVASEDLPDGGLCTFQVSDTAVCGRDVLIAVDETEA